MVLNTAQLISMALGVVIPLFNGLVTRWTVRRWTTVVGDGASDPAP